MRKVMLSIVLLTIMSTSAFSENMATENSNNFDWMYAEETSTENKVNHKCSKPIKLVSFKDSRQVEKYNEKVQYYSTCIKDFVNKYKNNRKYSESVNNAIKEWNSFAKSTQKEKSDNVTFSGSTGVKNGGSHTVGHSDPTRITGEWKF